MRDVEWNKSFDDLIHEARKAPHLSPLEAIYFIVDFLRDRRKVVKDLYKQHNSRELPVIRYNKSPQSGYYILFSAGEDLTMLKQMLLATIIILSNKLVLEDYSQETNAQNANHSLIVFLNENPTISTIHAKFMAAFGY